MSIYKGQVFLVTIIMSNVHDRQRPQQTMKSPFLSLKRGNFSYKHSLPLQPIPKRKI